MVTICVLIKLYEDKNYKKKALQCVSAVTVMRVDSSGRTHFLSTSGPNCLIEVVNWTDKNTG